MKHMKNYRQMAALLAFAALALAVPFAAQAAGTASGTPISNTATVLYSVGGVTQTQVSSGPTATFLVDNKVNLTVVANTANLNVVPGSTDRPLVFTLTNNGNTTQAYGLTVVSRATDSFDMNAIRIYRDNDNSGTLSVGDVQYADPTTFTDLASDATWTILIVADTPTPLANGSIAVQDLVATTYNSGGLVVTAQTTTATAGVDVVFADIAGSDSADIDRDGKHSAFGTYTVQAATISVVKSASTYSDPFNGTTNPKAIPGAVMTYSILVSNASGGQDATNVTVTDNLSAMPVTFATQFNDGVNSCNAGEGVVVNGTCTNNAGLWNAGTEVLTVSIPTLTSGTTVTIKFQVAID